MDVCFVPAHHPAQEKLPAVSGSSGHLVIERIHSPGEEPHWPGQVFAEMDLDYAEAMHQYAEATRERLIGRKTEKLPVLKGSPAWQKEMERRLERYWVRERRKREEADWKAAKSQHRGDWVAFRTLPKAERRQQQAAWEVKAAAWQELREQRRKTLQDRRQEDVDWHQRNRELKADPTNSSEERIWLAILVITDNCTRQSLGLPIFRTGSKLTSDELVAALRKVLPEELGFVISDQGTHFRSKAFAQLAQETGLVHIPVYRHRPESNGIAERFVLTLKDWLRSQSWETCEELGALLAKFEPEYNDRPHQGLAIPGLSPNEFSKRIWLM